MTDASRTNHWQRVILIQLSVLLLFIFSGQGGAVATPALAGSSLPAAFTHIVPRPKSMAADKGAFTFNNQTLIVSADNPLAKMEAQRFIERMKTAHGGVLACIIWK